MQEVLHQYLKEPLYLFQEHWPKPYWHGSIKRTVVPLCFDIFDNIKNFWIKIEQSLHWRFIQSKKFWTTIRARPIVSICCSPPESVAASWFYVLLDVERWRLFQESCSLLFEEGKLQDFPLRLILQTATPLWAKPSATIHALVFRGYRFKTLSWRTRPWMKNWCLDFAPLVW